MKNIGQGSLFDEPSESKRWHRVHAAPASGRGGCSLDIGPVRTRCAPHAPKRSTCVSWFCKTPRNAADLRWHAECF